MYLRRTTRRVGDKTYENYLLVESVATPKGPRQRVICSLGALAPGPKDEWLGTARRLHAALAGQRALVPDARVDALAARVRPSRRPPPAADPGLAIDPERVTFEDEREVGPVHVGHQMWRLLHLDTILADAGLRRRAQRLTEVMTLNRLVRPAAEHAMPDWIRRTALADNPGHGLHRPQRRSAVPQPRPVASAAGADRAGAGGPRAHAVQPGRHHLPLRSDVDVLRRALSAQPPGQARLFARSPPGLQTGGDRAGPGPRGLSQGARSLRRQSARSDDRGGHAHAPGGADGAPGWRDGRGGPRHGLRAEPGADPGARPSLPRGGALPRTRRPPRGVRRRYGLDRSDPGALAAQSGAEEDARIHQAPDRRRRGAHPLPQRGAHRQGSGDPRHARAAAAGRSRQTPGPCRAGPPARRRQDPGGDRPAQGALLAGGPLL